MVKRTEELVHETGGEDVDVGHLPVGGIFLFVPVYGSD